MKKNLVLVLGLVFLLYPIASCEPEDELNSMKSSESPTTFSTDNRIIQEDQSLDKEQIETVSCDEIESTTLYAGQDIEVGLVHISNSSDKIFVTYDLTHTSWSGDAKHLTTGIESQTCSVVAQSAYILHWL